MSPLRKYTLRLLINIIVAMGSQGLVADEAGDVVQSGVFMVRTSEDQPYNPSLLLKSDVSVEISGAIARVVVTQQFYNTSQQYVEGKYLFPLPEDAAINAMTIHIGDRVIKGEIHEKEEAKKIYQEARDQGKRAGLVEQQRANLFTTEVANIAPEEIVVVQISYIESIDRSGTEFSLYFPMTLTPRYTPVAVQDLQLNEAIQQKSKQLEASIDSPFIYSDTVPAEMSNPVRITVIINDADHVKDVSSSSHKLNTKAKQGVYEINTQDAFVPMDKDFKLSWKLEGKKESEAGFFMQKVGDDYYGLLMIMPPEKYVEDNILNREIIFIIDTSGSMGGESIKQAKASLALAVKRLNEKQRFNIIEFNSVHRKVFPGSVIGSTDNKDIALEFVDGLVATGGTEMAPALREALSTPIDSEYLRQIVFITDGSVSNESQLFGIINQLLGNGRLFTVGIGSAPNRLFMKKAAQLGHGTETIISNGDELDAMMTKLFGQLEKPVMRDIKIVLPGATQADFYPRQVPDLYMGEPIFLAMKMDSKPDSLQISGIGKKTWKKTINVPSSLDNPGVSTIWARAKIEALTDRMNHDENGEAVKSEIVQVALAHQLVSDYTSFVAVEEERLRPENADLASEQVANLMPAGSTMGRQYAMPKTAAGINFWLMLGLLLSLLCAFLQVSRRYA